MGRILVMGLVRGHDLVSESEGTVISFLLVIVFIASALLFGPMAVIGWIVFLLLVVLLVKVVKMVLGRWW